MPDVDKIIAFENGELANGEVLKLFGSLVQSGLVWQLQGSYGRTARDLIAGGFISPEGEVLVDTED